MCAGGAGDARKSLEASLALNPLKAALSLLADLAAKPLRTCGAGFTPRTDFARKPCETLLAFVALLARKAPFSLSTGYALWPRRSCLALRTDRSNVASYTLRSNLAARADGATFAGHSPFRQQAPFVRAGRAPGLDAVERDIARALVRDDVAGLVAGLRRPETFPLERQA